MIKFDTYTAKNLCLSWLVIVILIFSGKIRPATAADQSKQNIQINGSFEYATNPDIPDYWAGTGRFYRTNGLPEEFSDESGLKTFRDSFYLDDSTAYHGKRSIRITRPCFLLSMPMQVKPNQDYTVSLWIKGEFENRMVRLAITPRDTLRPVLESEVRVGTHWTRYELHLKNYSHNKLSLQVVPMDSGRIWIDAVQVEAGGQATEFVPSPYDDGFTMPQPVVHPKPGTLAIPTLVLREAIQASPVIDGSDRDPAWQDAKIVNMNDYMGAPSSVSTKVRMTYDKQALYLHIACDDPGDARGIGDSLEILIDVLGVGDPYYQFILDAQGNKRNYRSLRGIHQWDWQADWQAKTRMGESGWTAEIAIPFRSLPDTLNLANMSSLLMNVCRNYAPGPEKYLSWSPVTVGFLETERFGKVLLGSDQQPLEVGAIALQSSNGSESIFDLTLQLTSHTSSNDAIHLAVNMEELGQVVQVKTLKVDLPAQSTKKISIPGFGLSQKRSRLTLVLSDQKGHVLKQVRQFLDVPHPLELYTEYSYYTDESVARIVGDFNPSMHIPKSSKIELVMRVAGYPTKILTQTYGLDSNARQLFDMPIARRRAGQILDIDGHVIAPDGTLLAKAKTKLFKYAPNPTEVKVNRINRGMYLNGEPYIPYGLQVSSFGMSQLRTYKNNGFDFINYISHWKSPEKGVEFLANCESLGINVMAFHVARPNLTSPFEIFDRYDGMKSLIGYVPNDEESDPQVYDIALRSQLRNPYLLTAVNHNYTSYRAFAHRLEDLPGDALSIDRYPLLKLPNGRPHTTSEIYSVERCVEMMDRDAQRLHKPTVFWLQAAERFSKQPTSEEITWLTYILLANRCMGFTYFGGIPDSEALWNRMISLNTEIKQLKPYLFSMEDEPTIGLVNPDTQAYIRVLPKVIDNELVLICVNRAMTPIDAQFNLSAVNPIAQKSVQVFFEKRNVKLDNANILKDRFEPLARHVYKVKIQ